MTDRSDTQTTIPLSCGEAWIEFFRENVLDGSPTGNLGDDMQMAFDAGWNAAMRAMKEAHDA